MNTKRSRMRALAVVAMTGALTVIPALAAQAHVAEQTGPFDYEIGFGTEPARTRDNRTACSSSSTRTENRSST